MISSRIKIYLIITAFCLAVILLALYFIPKQDNNIIIEEEVKQEDILRHPLNGNIIESIDLFPIVIAIDNSYDIWPQHGLNKADIVYEALVEGNITRLLAVFDSNTEIDKIGPVRSARGYFMDWAEEYSGIYMHVGGSPQALSDVHTYNFIDINQIGAGEIYFWRDNKLYPPHNVFTSSANYLRAGELKEVDNITTSTLNFIDKEVKDNIIENIKINFSNEYYLVEWVYNNTLDVYQRYQGDEKFIYNTGEQVIADNIIIQIVDSYYIDQERRGMRTKQGGEVYIFNSLGKQEGEWKIVDNTTRYYTEEGEELNLVPGKTWIEIIDSTEKLIIE